MNASRKQISMSEKERSKQKVESFLNELEQGTVSLTDENLARLEHMIMERGGDTAAHVIVAPIGIDQPSNPRSRYSETSFDVHFCMEGNTEGRVDPEPGELELSSAGTGQLESPSAGTGFEAPGQQCLSNWEMEQTSTVGGCLLVGVSSNLGENLFPLEELAMGLTKDKESANEENDQLAPGGKGGEPSL